MCAAVHPELNYNVFLELHSPQLETSCVPKHLWETLYKKLKEETFDAGDRFMFAKVQDENEDESDIEVIAIEAIKKDDPEQIYLCDHAWTFRPNAARRILESNEILRKRLAAMMELESSDLKDVLPRIWRFAQSYSLNASQAENAVPIWYVVDELGSRISHSREANCRLIPFYFHPRQVAYSLLFPVEDIAENGIITRNYIEGPPTDEETAKALLIPWYDFDFSQTDFEQTEPEAQFFQSGRNNESMPELNGHGDGAEQHYPDESSRLKVFTEYSVLRENLQRDNRYEITSTFEDADIIWLNTHFKDFATLKADSPRKFINQFPFEHILTVKDLFAVVARRGARAAHDLTTFPEWLPTSFNMMTELPKFVSYFQQRQLNGLDNYWIVKPFNLARSLDTYISDNLDFIVRLATTGPKMVCKYITNPVLFHRDGTGKVKFDIRYCVLLRNVNPLKLLVHRMFYLRFANQPYSLDDFDVYEKHFTVMNYAEDVEMKNMLCHEFIDEFERQNPGVRWKTVETKIFTALKELFSNAVKLPPPRGIGHNPQSRAMYAVDLMLQWNEGEIQPKLLELNWAPDCKRACEFYPKFFGDVFDALFKDDLSAGTVVELL